MSLDVTLGTRQNGNMLKHVSYERDAQNVNIVLNGL